MTVTVKTIVEGGQVWINDVPLAIRESRAIHDHSREFSWGYLGVGPLQTSLSICLHLYGPYIAPKVYRQFQCNFVQHWHRWDDGERTVDAYRFYREYVDGVIMKNAVNQFCNNMYDRMYAALETNTEAVDLLRDSTVVTMNMVETCIILRTYSKSVEIAAEKCGLSCYNLDGKWNVAGSMPTTKYLRQFMALEKNSLQV